MLHLFLMLLGLSVPNSNANRTATNDQNHPVITTNNTDPGDTGGETGQLPPR